MLEFEVKDMDGMTELVGPACSAGSLRPKFQALVSRNTDS
jgi:hypothetical protein